MTRAVSAAKALFRRFAQEQRGAVTAEFALTIPVVLFILGIAVGSIFLAAERVSLVSLAGEVARLEARGDSRLAATRLAAQPGIEIARTNDGRILCITAVSRPGPGVLAAVKVSGRGCAAVAHAAGL